MSDPASSYTADASDRDRARFWAGDTVDGAWLLSDAEWDMLVGLQPNPVRAAQLGLRSLAAKFARIPDVVVEGNTVSGSSLSKAFADRADDLDGVASSVSTDTALPYVAGLSLAELADDRADTDLVQPKYGLVGAVRTGPAEAEW